MSTIDVVFQAAVHMSGISKKNGQPFDFSEVRYLVPIQLSERENFQLRGYGAESQSIPLADAKLIHKFSDLKIGSWVTLQLGPDPRNVQRNVCTGVQVHQDAKAS